MGIQKLSAEALRMTQSLMLCLHIPGIRESIDAIEVRGFVVCEWWWV